MTSSRLGHTAVTLPNGRVLVMGGRVSDLDISTNSSTEVFDLNTGTWSLVDLMNEPRSFFAAVLLNNNKVLAIGGAPGERQRSYMILEYQILHRCCPASRPTPSRREAVLQECNCPVPTFSRTPSHLKETRGW